MQSHFYISQGGHESGPHEVNQIIEMLKEGRLSPFNYIYDESAKDWVLLMEHELTMSVAKSLKPKAPPKVAIKEPEKVIELKRDSEQTVSAISTPTSTQEWFVLKGDNRFGPYAYIDLVLMLQNGTLFEFDFIWCSQFEGWKRVAEVEDFKPEKIKALKNSDNPAVKEVFFRRRYQRVKYGTTLLIHDNKNMWKGYGVEISEGGAGLYMENSLIIPGQILYLHFKPGDDVPSFNAVCEVVSKGFTGDVRDPKAKIFYGVAFKSIQDEAIRAIQNLTKKTRGSLAA